MIRNILLGNLPLKSAAVVLAVILWFFVISKGQTEISLNVPIEYLNVPSGLEISRREVKAANIVVRIHESLSKNIRQETVRVDIDVSKAKKGEGVFPIRKDDVKLPFGASVIRVEPSSVKIFFEETVSKTVSVRPEITGTPETGYYVRSVDVSPKEIVIEGAKSAVRRVGVIRTEPIDIAGLNEDLRLEAALKLNEGNIRTKVERVDVSIRIARRGK